MTEEAIPWGSPSGSETEYTPIPEGVYKLELDKVEFGGVGKFGPQVKWTWNVWEKPGGAAEWQAVPFGDSGQRRIVEKTSVKLGFMPADNTPSKARARIEAMEGASLEDRDITESNADAVIAASIAADTAWLMAVLKDSEPWGDDKVVFSNIEAVFPDTDNGERRARAFAVAQGIGEAETPDSGGKRRPPSRAAQPAAVSQRPDDEPPPIGDDDLGF